MNPAGLFNRSVTVRTYTASTENSGSPKYTYDSLLDQTIYMAIQPRSSSESPEDGRVVSTRRAVGYAPITASISAEYRIVDGSTIWRVVGPSRNVGGRGVFYTVDLEEET